MISESRTEKWVDWNRDQLIEPTSEILELEKEIKECELRLRKLRRLRKRKKEADLLAQRTSPSSSQQPRKRLREVKLFEQRKVQYWLNGKLIQEIPLLSQHQQFDLLDYLE